MQGPERGCNHAYAAAQSARPGESAVEKEDKITESTYKRRGICTAFDFRLILPEGRKRKEKRSLSKSAQTVYD